MSGYVNASAGSTSVRTRLERERYEREEREAAERKLKPLLDEQTNLLVQIDKGRKDLVRQFYGRDVSVVRDEVKVNHPLAVDEGLDVSEGRITEGQWNRALNDWVEHLTERTGITLNVVGLSRVVAYAVAQLRAGKDMSTAAAFNKCYNRLFDSGAFGQDEVGFDESLRIAVAPTPAPEPAPEPNIESLLATDAGTVEGRRAAHQIADSLYENEVVPLYSEWVDFIYQTYNHVVSRIDADKIEAWFQKTQKSRLDRRSWDEVRKYLVLTLNHWPMSMLSAEEQALIAIENVERRPNESDYAYRLRCQQAARG